MKLKLLKSSVFLHLSLLMTGLFLCHSVMAQSLYVGANAEFYLPNNVNFTTSNTVVQLDTDGVFSVEAGNNWGSSQEYVNGKVTSYGSGVSILPTGDNGVYAPVTLDHSADVSATYVNASPLVGSNGTDVDAVGVVEYWELTGTGVVTLPYNENSDITSLVNNNGGVLNALSIVGYNGGVWDLISATHTSTVTGDLLNGEVTSDASNSVNLDGFAQFTFGIDHQTVLAVNDLFLTTAISLLANPVKAEESNIQFMASGELVDLKASIYDINGRLVKSFDKVELKLGMGNLPKSNLKSGLYFVKFENEGKQGIKKVLIE